MEFGIRTAWAANTLRTSMGNLKITKAMYYNPQIGAERGIDVTSELSSQIIQDRLFYNGIYQNIFPDPAKGIHKKLKIELQFRAKSFIKFYNENEKIDLPNDLGNVKNKWINPNNPWLVGIIGGTLATIIGGLVIWKITH